DLREEPGQPSADAADRDPRRGVCPYGRHESRPRLRWADHELTSARHVYHARYRERRTITDMPFALSTVASCMAAFGLVSTSAVWWSGAAASRATRASPAS